MSCFLTVLVMDVPENSSAIPIVQDYARKPMLFRPIQTPHVPLAVAGIGLIPAEAIAGTILNTLILELPISLLQDLLYHRQSAVHQRMLRRQYRESKPLDRMNLAQ